MNNLFVMDAETDGIYGNVLSIAVKVIYSFSEIDRFYGAVKIKKEEIATEWVKENVFDTLKNAEIFFNTENELLEAFWEFYSKYYKEYDVIADVAYPVETGIFRKCIEKDKESREKLSPFPIYDLESFLVAKGYDKLADREKLAKTDLKRHDAMNDVDITIRILRRFCEMYYSYHTFMFPFVWRCENNSKMSIDDYCNMLDKKWEPYSVEIDETRKNTDEDKKFDLTDIQSHKIFQYFTPAARQSILGCQNNGYVRCYIYDHKNVHDMAIYHIKKAVEEKIFEYNLLINAIKLKVYNTGIAILKIETQNEKYKSIKDVKAINEYGRRLFMPYIKNAKKNDCDVCADELGFNFNQNSELNYDTISGSNPSTKDDIIPNFIKVLLPKINIKSAIDDRMFVCCCVCDREFTEKAKEYKKLSDINSDKLVITEADKAEKGKDPAYVSEYDRVLDIARSLYELIYIDREGSCSCTSNEMLEKLLVDSIYDRWEFSGESYGTYTMATHHSLVFLTDGGEGHVVESFLTQYAEIAATVLSQRAAMIVFDCLVSDLSKDFEKDKNKIGLKKIKEIRDLQEKHIAFLNQHMNIEITCQEQGIEIYELLQKSLYIKDEIEMLAKEIELLTNAANTANDVRLNRIAIIVGAVLSTIEILPNAIEALPNIVQYIVSLFK